MSFKQRKKSINNNITYIKNAIEILKGIKTYIEGGNYCISNISSIIDSTIELSSNDLITNLNKVKSDNTDVILSDINKIIKNLGNTMGNLKTDLDTVIKEEKEHNKKKQEEEYKKRQEMLNGFNYSAGRLT